MPKISWIKRIFMSWKSLVDYFSHEETSIELLKKQNEDLKSWNNDLRSDKEKLNVANEVLKNSLDKTKYDNENQKKELLSQNEKIFALDKNISVVRTKLNEKINNQDYQKDINEKLMTLSKIDRTFFGYTGNKGKGKLGEMQVKTILEKSGFSKNLWVENLSVGNYVVEFAIKSVDSGKWIPIDSKVLDAQCEEDGTPIIDAVYKNKVNAQAKEIAKYLFKKNTAGYGILVLQNDFIYIKLYDEFPELFKETLQKHKVHIASPSSFIQAAWSISQIVEAYDKISSDLFIYEEMMSILGTVTNFANSLAKTHSQFNIAMSKHFPSIENKHKKIGKKLVKFGKIKQIQTIEKGDK